MNVMLPNYPCPFCTIPESRIVDRNAVGFTIRDGFPISPGHKLIIPYQHTDSFFSLPVAHRSALLALLDNAKAAIDEECKPLAYNIGINDGVAAGQTVPHLHIHLIPRYEGDVPDARGGVSGRYTYLSKLADDLNEL